MCAISWAIPWRVGYSKARYGIITAARSWLWTWLAVDMALAKDSVMGVSACDEGVA